MLLLCASRLTEWSRCCESSFDLGYLMSLVLTIQLFASGLHTDDHFFTSETEEGGSVGHTTASLSGGGSLVGGSTHSLPARRDSRSAGDMGISIGKRASKGGGLFSRVNATEQARDVERMNAEVMMA